MEDNNVNNIIQNNEDKTSIYSATAEGNLSFSQNRDEFSGSGGGSSSSSGGSSSGSSSSNVNSSTNTSQLASDNLTPILLILGDSPDPEPEVDEEPVLLEEDNEIKYKLQKYDELTLTYSPAFESMGTTSIVSKDFLIGINDNQTNDLVSLDKSEIVISYDNNSTWCNVSLKKASDTDVKSVFSYVGNIDDLDKIWVPDISVDKNETSNPRDTTIIFNIKNTTAIINLKIFQKASSDTSTSELTPVIINYIGGNAPDYQYEILKNTTYYINTDSDYMFKDINYTTPLLFALMDKDSNIDNNLTKTKEEYSKLFTTTSEGYNFSLSQGIAAKNNTSLTITITQPTNPDKTKTIVVYYNGTYFFNLKYKENTSSSDNDKFEGKIMFMEITWSTKFFDEYLNSALGSIPLYLISTNNTSDINVSEDIPFIDITKYQNISPDINYKTKNIFLYYDFDDQFHNDGSTFETYMDSNNYNLKYIKGNNYRSNSKYYDYKILNAKGNLTDSSGSPFDYEIDENGQMSGATDLYIYTSKRIGNNITYIQLGICNLIMSDTYSTCGLFNYYIDL